MAGVNEVDEIIRHKMRRPKTIVVGYDGSSGAQRALSYARERSEPDGRVVVVYAFSPPPAWNGTPYYERTLIDQQSHGRSVLESLDGRLPNSVWTALVQGPPAEALIRVAQARKADEIVVGSRGLGRLRGALDSVSHALLHEADRPVVVVPGGDRVAGDDSPKSGRLRAGLNSVSRALLHEPDRPVGGVPAVSRSANREARGWRPQRCSGASHSRPTLTGTTEEEPRATLNQRIPL